MLLASVSGLGLSSNLEFLNAGPENYESVPGGYPSDIRGGYPPDELVVTRLSERAKNFSPIN